MHSSSSLLQSSYNATVRESLFQLVRLTLSNMKWVIFNTLSPLSSEATMKTVQDWSREDFLKDFYQICPYCKASCSGQAMCSPCHTNRIYKEEFKAVFGCTCWENGEGYQHSCGSSGIIRNLHPHDINGDVNAPDVAHAIVPNWISPLEQMEISRRERRGQELVQVLLSQSKELADLALPPEIMCMIFDYLDETSIVKASRVCRRWEALIKLHFEDDLWKELLLQRWPLFRPSGPVHDWLSTYFHMMDSIACKTCFLNVVGDLPVPNFNGKEGSSRESRLEKEIVGLNMNGPEGIEAIPLDSARYNWLARIEAPRDSPYDGGVFYLSITFPRNYPFQPPTCRMLTKILHPNISRHGRIGLRIFNPRHWTPCNTVRSFLIAIQNLLANPVVTKKEEEFGPANLQSPQLQPAVVLELSVGEVYLQNHPKFLALARSWTHTFAQHSECAAYRAPPDAPRRIPTGSKSN